MWDNFWRVVIFVALAAALTTCVSCSVFGGGDRVCPEGLLKKVEYETDRSGDRVIKSISCYPEGGQRP